MAFSRRLGVIGILGASWLVAVGCGSDDNKKVNGGDTAGEGGEAAGGTPSSGGSNSNAGKGGMVIVAGGEGGSAVAGTAGTGGSGGTAGSGGTTADAGAAGMAGAAAAGAGGDGGAGGGGNVTPVVAKQCRYGCGTDDDCKVGEDDSHKCNPTTKRCEDPMTSCAVHQDCLPFGNFLFFGCVSAEADCNVETEACVLLHGRGWCVPLADVETGCTQIGGDSLSVPNVGIAGESNVCLYTTARCNAGSCIFGCADAEFGGCDTGTGNTCNSETGLCECAESTECTADGVSACGADSHCGCNNAGDCSEANVPGQSACVAGTCGCADATECPDPGYANATAVCE